MSIHEFIDELSSRGVTLVPDGEELRVRARQGVLTPALRDKIAVYKVELLAMLQAQHASAESNELPQIVADQANRYQPFPLTDIQHAYWIGRGDSLELGNVAVHAYLEIEHDGLDVARLSAALRALIRRHDMLRMVIDTEGQQRVLENVPAYEIALTDLRGAASDVAHAHLMQVRDTLSHQMLPTDTWPLFDIRATAYEVGKVRLHVSLDILMADLWSLFRLFTEWRKFYDDPAAQLPRLEISFRDYVLAEQALAGSAFFQTARDYWVKRLEELPPAPDLPLATRPEAISRPRFTRRSYEIGAVAWDHMRKIAGSIGVTPSGLLLAAFAEVMAAWSKSPRFTLNLTLFNRLGLHPQVNELIGDFTTTILLAVDNSPQDLFEDRARRLQKQLYADLEHRAYNGVRVMRELAQRRSAAPNATMPVVFSSALGLSSMDADASVVTQLGGQFGEVVYTLTQTPQVWIDHQVFEHNGALRFNWDVIEALFPDGMLDAMFSSYCGLLEQFAAGEAWNAQNPVRIPPEQLQQRQQVNDTVGDHPDLLLHELFTKQARLTPAAEAVVRGNRRITYAQLFSSSNRLARRLRDLGALPNTLVAIVLDKGWEQIVAALGILGSGAAYLPIDPEFPPPRRDFLLTHGRVRLVVTTAQYRDRFEWPENVTCVCVDDADLDAVSDAPLDSVQQKDDLAYVIFTSGSTGEPKGVMIEHGAVVNTVLDINKRHGITAGDRVLAVSSLGFDLSVYDIFGMLAAGGVVVFPAAEDGKEVGAWWQLVRTEQITVWNSVPALFQMLVDYVAGSGAETASQLRLILLSGDWIPLDLPDRARALWSAVNVISMGGATEASIWSIDYPVRRIDPAWQSIPYGKPLTNQRFHVLDAHLDPRPVWAVGQLYIGGVGLARGYWRDTDKTAKSFVICPATGERLYKTGDLGRYLPDGNIEFLGREDAQVKVNGFRIELGELETVLNQHPEVKEAVVVAHGERGGDKRLVAYVVPENKSGVTDSTPHDLDPVAKMDFKLEQPGLRQDRQQRRSVALTQPALDETGRRAHLARQSYRSFCSEPLALTQLSGMLGALCQMRVENAPLPKYRYPSAGSLYPVQTYVYVKPQRVEGLEAGVYYHDPEAHALVFLHGPNGTSHGAFVGITHAPAEAAAFAVFSISRPQAIQPLYGELSRDFCLLEAGYMGQILMENATDHLLGLCLIGRVDFAAIRKLFDLEDDQELLQTFVGGAIAPEDMRQWWTGTQSMPLDNRLQIHMKGRLPGYMVPSHFMMLNRLPLTANGKIDRKALPEPSFLDKTPHTPAMPRNPLEEKLAALFISALKLEKVGVDESFFELGGDSLQATRLVAAIGKTFNVSIKLRDLFKGPTIAELGSLLNELVLSGAQVGAVEEHEEEGEI